MASRSTGGRAGSTSTSSRRNAGVRRGAPRAKKRFGQHFLTDAGILNRIVDAAEIAPGESVLEVGPGRGALTAALAARGGRVVAVEVDRDLITTLKDRFAGSATVAIVEADALRHEPAALLAMGGASMPYLVVANLPYNVAAPLLRRFLEAEWPPRRLVVMVQLEVAQAICARPGAMSLIGVATQVYGEPRLVMKVAPGAFTPPPKVRSALVRIDVAPHPRVDAPLDAFFRVVRAGFSNPRKQLRNSLAFGLNAEHGEIDAVTRAAGIDATLRPAMLSLDDWASIARAWLSGRGE